MGDLKRNIFAIQIDCRKLYHTETLSQTFVNEQSSFMSENCQVAFLSHRLGDLEVTYALHRYMVGKRVIDMRRNILNSALCKGVGHFEAKY